VPAALTGCGPRAESNPSNGGEVAFAENNIEPTEAAPTELPIVRLGIDINDLPQDDIYADREERSPERVRSVYEKCLMEIENGSGNLDEFIELFQTKEDEVYPNGVFDEKAAGDAFAYRLEMALNAFCHPEYLGPHVDFPDDGSFTREMMRNEIVIPMVQGLGGYPEAKYGDQEIMDTELFDLVSKGRQVAADNYIRNAQRQGGNLNGTINIIPGDHTISENDDPIYSINASVTLTNAVDAPNLPEETFKIDGTVWLAVFPPSEGTDAVMYVPDKNPNVTTPLDELASTA
jgi:hypothetical protein